MPLNLTTKSPSKKVVILNKPLSKPKHFETMLVNQKKSNGDYKLKKTTQSSTSNIIKNGVSVQIGMYSNMVRQRKICLIFCC
jgi:hypothetical protein